MTTINRLVDFPKPPKRRSFETLSNADQNASLDLFKTQASAIYEMSGTYIKKSGSRIEILTLAKALKNSID